jgi:nicotinamidase-related amidase
MAKLGVLVDAQVDFITGALANKFAQEKVPNIVNKIKHWDGAIIATHDTHFNKMQVTTGWPPMEGKPYEETLEGQKLVPHCIKLTDGWEIEKTILDELQKKNQDGKHNFYSVDKYTFGKLDLPEYIRNLAFDFDEVELCGFVAGICVDSNATILRALFPNMKITVDAACTAGFGPDDENAAYTCMKMKEIDVINED